MTGFMRLSDYWNANPDKVHGIYIDATSYSLGDSNAKKEEPQKL